MDLDGGGVTRPSIGGSMADAKSEAGLPAVLCTYDCTFDPWRLHLCVGAPHCTYGKVQSIGAGLIGAVLRWSPKFGQHVKVEICSCRIKKTKEEQT
jgi:hypothetical protein